MKGAKSLTVLGWSSIIILSLSGWNDAIYARSPVTSHRAPVAVCDEVINNKVFQVSQMVIKARPDQVWEILTDYNHATRVFPNLKESELVKSEGSVKLVKHVVHPTGLFGTYQYVVEIKENPPYSMEWHRVRGDFKRVDGYWKLVPAEGGRSTRVTYAAHIDGGFFIPQALVRDQVKDDMPIVMASLRDRAEANTVADRPVTSQSR